MFDHPRGRTVLAAAGVFAVCIGCGNSPRHVADPLARGITGGHVVIDRLVCQPTPDTCERVVVMAPVGVGQAQLKRSIEARLSGALGWTPTHFQQVVERDEGAAFDGRTSRHGGWVDDAQSEVRFWIRTGWAQEVPVDRDEQALLAAAKATPDGVVVTIM